MARRDTDQGMTIPGPIRSTWGYKGADPNAASGNGKREFQDELFRWHPRLRCEEFVDFQPGTALPAGWAARITKTAGSPAATVSANGANGVLTCALDATNEAQLVGIDWADQLVVPATARWMMQARVKLVTALTASESVICGVNSTYLFGISAQARYARFKIVNGTGGNTVAYSYNDGVTAQPQLGLDTQTVILTTGQWYILTVDSSGQARNQVRLFLDDSLIQTFPVPNFALTDLLQPCVAIQKAAVTDTGSLAVDWVRVAWDRLAY